MHIIICMQHSIYMYMSYMCYIHVAYSVYIHVPVDIFPEGVELHNFILFRGVKMMGHVLSNDLYHGLQLDPEQDLVPVAHFW